MSNADIERAPFARHARYYGSEHLTFAVDGYLFQLPVRRLQGSKYFQEMLGSEHLGSSVEGRSDQHPIVLGGITSFEMESFVDILDARIFDTEVQREWKHLAAALHLATMWEFEDVRTWLIKDMSRIIGNGGVGPLDRVETSIQCRVNDWLHPAYQALCDRAEGVTTEEAKRLGMDRLAAIYRVRDRRHVSTAAQRAYDAASSAYNSASITGYCYDCGNNVNVSRNNTWLQTLAPVQTPTLDLIKAEDILSSLEGPLP